jgi:hypothetical protein
MSGKEESVEKIAAWIPATDELLLGAGYQSDYLVERVMERKRQADAAWAALPWYTRVQRTLYYWSWRIPRRFEEWLHRDCER